MLHCAFSKYVCISETTYAYLLRFLICILSIVYCRKTNIMDNMVTLLEKHASNLEELVQTRTKELQNEKLKTDVLLYKLLPKYV